MKKLTLILGLSSIIFASCQKEISWDVPLNPGGNTDSTDTTINGNGTLLTKTVSVEDGDTSTSIYTYTADKKIDAITTTGRSHGEDAGDYRKFYRDATGRIIRIAEKIADRDGIAVDTVFTNVYYPNASTFNYSYKITNIAIDGFEVNDSTLYTYNGNGQVTESYTYESSDIFGPDQQEIKALYTYDAAGNILNITGYNNASGAMEQVTTFDMEYDGKTNPLGFDRQELLISGGHPGASHNNVTVITFNHVGEPQPQVIKTVYTYGANNLPATSVVTDYSGNTGVSTTTFYYQ